MASICGSILNDPSSILAAMEEDGALLSYNTPMGKAYYVKPVPHVHKWVIHDMRADKPEECFAGRSEATVNIHWRCSEIIPTHCSAKRCTSLEIEPIGRTITPTAYGDA